ncbi:nuclear transport factor 2 family protein [Tenacibaculum amylolyticum]|uniref:nuclear transport factor 2 family protein n=1 Tax=Tenacibaculum amylolyticum TaxID=104269 RepID=UPI003896333B
MRTIGIILVLLCTTTVGCQNTKKSQETQKTAIIMTEVNTIEQVVTKVFINTDNRNWEGVQAQFGPKVLLDYASMSGNPAAELTPKAITDAWKTVLPGFTSTHHQIGNFITEVNGTKAHVFCYGTATHYLEDEAGNVWTVVGSYDFNVEQIEGNWKVTSMKFNYKYQDGNSGLIQKAIENAK